MILTKCVLDEMFQSVSHVGWTWRRVLHSGHNLLLDGVDHKQEPVYRKRYGEEKRDFRTKQLHLNANIYSSLTVRSLILKTTQLKNRYKGINSDNHH